jgi:hypothetical protein
MEEVTTLVIYRSHGEDFDQSDLDQLSDTLSRYMPHVSVEVRTESTEDGNELRVLIRNK